ncbi:cobaltochelatase subunit CobN, partial [Rhizobium brockwellii]|uniref:cobaltochelatase subunit CobN n=1 Tax=Rhizobium brockwellii TaxID=3019932 RepID=UPI003F9B591D
FSSGTGIGATFQVARPHPHGYPNRDGRLGNGVGLDTPEGTVEVLRAMRSAGCPVAEIPADGDALIRHMMEGPTNSGSDGKIVRETLSL